ncbi:CsgG/HfaB family protein [Aureisphaera galaxeae]|uniref:CsgG/HfaB family protein n=1 Tax=Aureisphaera galaxeae TaxID=1538023 RepID=UPI002350B3D5|nr:CsgG/HfaB family protein [Aureisphaera galaxeae]MDC8006198.1 CsgG/HfaB family protein [Aureisphaera galaxeae]
MKKLFYLLVASQLFTACGTYFNQPYKPENARIGERTPRSQILEDFPLPQEPVVVGVYNFKDQTGQYKSVENGSTFSTAVSQGATTMLIKALEDSKWFTPIERENLNNLLNERNIIRTTRDEFRKTTNPNEPKLPPLLFAGILLEGGIVSYDSNIVTGGVGARYFGVGGSTQYRQDRITIYLRAVSTANGKILKTVYVSKTILSQAVDASLFRYVNFQRLLEAETGMTKNEPVQLAMKDAIEKAVESLIIEGIMDQLWSTQEGGDTNQRLVDAYLEEKALEESTLLYSRRQRARDFYGTVNASGFATIMNGDYQKKPLSYGGSLGYSHKLANHFNINANFTYQNFESSFNFDKEFFSTDLNLEYIVLPYDNFTPFVYGGGGVLFDPASTQSPFGKLDPAPKVQGGVGVIAQLTDRWAIRGFFESDLLFTDELDGLENGKRDDYYYNFGLGVSFSLGKKKRTAPLEIEGIGNSN